MPAQLDGRLASPDRPSPGDRCPIDRALQVLGPRSAMLLLREAAYGTTRFDDLTTRTGISDAVASTRLRELVDAGLLERRPYREPGRRTRHEYVITASGEDLLPVMLSLAAWGRRHTGSSAGPTFLHADCGAEVDVEVRCRAGHAVDLDDLVVRG